VLSLVLASVVTTLASFGIASLEKRRGFLCRDVHKPSKPLVPCSVGAAMFLGFIAGAFMLLPFKYALATSLSIFIALLIGLVDDLKGLTAYQKIGLGLLPAIPIIALHTYRANPWVPLFGHTRMSIVYPILVFIAFTVFCNGANMIDTHNGLLSGGALITSVSAFALLSIVGKDGVSLALVSLCIAVLAPYFVLNAYPSRVFNGNAGSFLIGALLALEAVVAHLEAFLIFSNMVMFLNGLLYLLSVRGFLQRQHVKRPVVMDDNCLMMPSADPQAPITIVRLLLAIARRPISERELVASIHALYIVTSAIAISILMLLGYS